ncbi:MAG: Asp-tRNA(Asn)/Glu-tRNA(Gln) amidotransferase subunit GatC [Streptococcus salivarius]
MSKLSFLKEQQNLTTLSKIVDMVEPEQGYRGCPCDNDNADRKTLCAKWRAGDDRDELFKNVPQSENYYIKVPAILEDGDA